MATLAKKEVSINNRPFVISVNQVKPVEGGHYVEVWWSVQHMKDSEETSFKLMEGDGLLKAAKYDFETGTLKKVVFARKLLAMLQAEAVGGADYFEFYFSDTNKGAAGETLGQIGESLYLDLTKPG